MKKHLLIGGYTFVGLKVPRTLKLSIFGLALLSGMMLTGLVWGAPEVIDSFNDGNFTSSPTWAGDTGSWEIVADSDVADGATNSYTLRLNVSTGSGTQHLSVQRSGSWGVAQSWGFWLGRRGQAATGSNESIVWLWASDDNLELSTLDGYRIIFGDNSGDDEIRLERLDDGSPTELLASSGAAENGLTDIGFLVRVTRTSGSVWTLFTSTLPTATDNGVIATNIPSKTNTSVNQGSVTDSTYTSFDNGYLGVVAVHTSSADARSGAEFDQFYFDTDSDSSLPVELSVFTATQTENGVILRWRTESETSNLGFRIYRSDQRTGEYVKINPALIRGGGTTATPREYTFADPDAELGLVYYYYIEDVAFDGKTSQSPIIQTRGTLGVSGKLTTTWGRLKRE